MLDRGVKYKAIKAEIKHFCMIVVYLQNLSYF